MPYNKFKKKQNYKKKNPTFGVVPKSKFVKKKTGQSNFVSTFMVKYNHARLPMPTRYRCRFMNEVFVSLSAGNADAQFGICLNSVYRPFTIPAGAGSPGNINTTPWTLQGGYTIQTNPIGLSNLVNTTASGTSGIYDFYKVIGAKIQVIALPSALGDSGYLNINPYINTNLPSSEWTGVNDPFAVSGVTTQFVGKANNVKKYVKPWNVFGLKKRVYMDDVSGQYSSTGNSNPSQLLTWYVSWLATDNAVTAQIQTFRIRVDYWVELWSPPGKLFIST